MVLWLHPADRRRYDDEMTAVVESLCARALREGGRPAFLRAALGELGALALAGVARRAERRRGGGGIMGFFEDTRQALRGIVRAADTRRMHVLASVAVIAIGVGAHTTVFSVVHAVLLGPVAIGGGGEQAELWSHRGDPERAGPGVPTRLLFALRSEESVFRVLEGFTQQRGVLGVADDPVSVQVIRGTPGLMGFFGVRPAWGTGLDGAPGGARSALLSHELWRTRFGGDRSILGRAVQLDGEPLTVIGVLPRAFYFPDPGPSVWIPVSDPREPEAPASMFAVGWLRPGVTVAAADEALVQHAEGMRAEGILDDERHLTVIGSVMIGTPGPTRRALSIFVGAVTFILAVAAANALGLAVAQAVARRPEMAVCSALGGGLTRLVRRLVIEGVILGATAGVLGFGLAWAGLRALVAAAPAQFRMVTFGRGLDSGSIDLAYALGLGVLVGLVVGAAQAGVATTVARSGLAGARTSTRDRVTGLTRHVLVIAQVAFSFVLLAGSVVLGRSFLSLSAVDPGYTADRLLLARLRLPAARRTSVDEADAFFTLVGRRFEAIPGVQAVAETTSPLPLSGARFRPTLTTDAGAEVFVEGFLPVDRVRPGYFAAAGIATLSGRPLADGDPPGAVVVAARLARALWPTGPAVGRRFRIGEDEWHTVVGVAEDVPHISLRGTEHGFAYYARLGEESRRRGDQRTFLLRTAGSPSALVPRVRAALRELDATLPFESLVPMEQALGSSIARERFFAQLMGAFAVAAVLLAGLGLYAALAWHVSARVREIGIRMTLGADAERLFRGVAGRGALLSAVGVAIGLVGALSLARVLRSIVFGMEPADPSSLVGTAVFFVVVAMLASALPGLRAVRVDPMRTLSAE